MLNRYLSLALLVCVAASTVALAQNPGAEYLFQLPGCSGAPATCSGQFVPYNALGTLQAPLANTSGPSGISAILATPNGNKFYLIGSGGIQAVDPTFQNFSGTVNLPEPSGLTPTVTAAALTPNGTYLLVGTTDSSNQSYLFIVSTSTNSVLTGNSLPIQLGGQPGPSYLNQTAPCPTCYIAVSRDSSTAYVLENPVSGTNTQVVAYSLTNFAKLGSAAASAVVAPGFFGAGNGLTLSPQNQLYLAANGAITVIDPVSLLQIGSTIQVDVNCSQLQFTPDGTTAYAINQTPRSSGSASLMALTVSSGTVSYWPTLSSAQGPQLTSVFVAGNNSCASGHCIFAYSSPAALGSATGTFYDVTPVTGGLSASVSQPSPTLSSALASGGQPCPNVASVAECVLAATVSNELPASNYLYVLIANGNEPYLDRISLSTDTVSVTNGSPVIGSASSMEFVSIPVQSTTPSFITFNANQTVNTGGTSLPLIARAIGGAGLPVFNATGVFSVDSTTGLTITTPNWTTGADGYALTTVSVPAGGATCPNAVCTVTYTLGGASTTFSITVPGSGATGGTGPGGGGGTTSSQVIITSGQGQLVLINNSATYPLSVEVTDSNGNPLPNVTVAFTVTVGSGSVYPSSAVTDATGTASTSYSAQAVSGNNSFETDTVVATAPQGSATFTETAFVNPTEGIGIAVSINKPLSGQIVQVSPGAPATNAIQAVIQTNPFGGFTSTPIPDVGIVLLNVLNPTQPAPFSCQGNPVSDMTGTLNCTLATTCSTPIGTYQLAFKIGGSQEYDDNGSVQVTAGGGGASQIAITSGNNQNGNAGQRAALPLIATLTSFCGAPVVGTTVNWTVTKGSATLQSASSSSNVLGQVSNVLTFGQTPGAVTVTATIPGGASVSFTLTNNIVISGITAVSGTGQTATVNQAFANPLVISVVDNNHNPVSGLAVTFTVSSSGGTATVNPTSTDTGANGQAQTSVTAGSVPGPVTVTASITGGFTATFSLSVVAAGPTVTASSFVNAASSVPGLVPCGLGTVTGPGLATAVNGIAPGVSPFGPLPYTVAGLSMTINAIPTPIQAVANENGVQQVNFQTPCETAGSTSATVVISVNNTNTTVTGVPVFAAQPGIFTYAGPNNLPYGAVFGNGNYVTPNNLAQRGQTYYVVVTGLGQTNPPMITNSPGSASENVAASLIVGVNNNGVPVVSAYAYPDQIGVYLVGFQIPLTTPTSSTAVPLSVAAVVNGTVMYSNSVFLAGIM
jgi:hypothetical protein